MTTIAKLLSIVIPLIWCGMIIAISLIETPLKFRAPGMTLPLGLGIGQLVFSAFNKLEWLLCIAWLAASFIASVVPAFGSSDRAFNPSRNAFLTHEHPMVALSLPLLAAIILLLQTCWLLPHLESRTALIQKGLTPAGPSLHRHYVSGEIMKIILLAGAGCQSIVHTLNPSFTH